MSPSSSSAAPVPPLFSSFANLRGWAARVVGGRLTARREVGALAEAGGSALAVAASLHATLRDAVQHGRVRHSGGEFAAEHLEDKGLLVAANGDDAVSRAAAQLAFERALATSSQDAEHGNVTPVGAGPGDSGLLTLDALRALQQADGILHDRLVGADVLDLAGREAQRTGVGKRVGDHPGAALGQPLAVYMAIGEIDSLTHALIAHGRAADTACVVVENGTTPQQRVLHITLAKLLAFAHAENVCALALLIIGKVAASAERAWRAERCRDGLMCGITRAA